MAVPKVSFRDGDGALKYVDAHKQPDGAFCFNSTPDTNVSTFTYAFGAQVASLQTAYCLIAGSATKVVRVRQIDVTPVDNDAFITPLLITLASDQGVSGSAVFSPVTPASHEQAASATGAVYTIASNMTTLPTSAGRVVEQFVKVADAGDYTKGDPITYSYKFGNDGSQGIVLRGVNQCLYFNNNGNATQSGLEFYINVKVTEELE